MYYFFKSKKDGDSKNIYPLHGQITEDGKPIMSTKSVACSRTLRSSFPEGTVFGSKVLNMTSGANPIYATSDLAVVAIDGRFASVKDYPEWDPTVFASTSMREAYEDYIKANFDDEEYKAKSKETMYEMINRTPLFSCPDVEKDGYYVDGKIWSVLMMNVLNKTNTLLFGPSGTGKTEIINEIARRLKLPIHIIDCGGVSDPQSQLLGTHRLAVDPQTGQTVSRFEYAPLCSYIQQPGIVVFDEINRCDATNLLLPLLDFRRSLAVSQAEESGLRDIPVHPDCVFFATANIGAEYTGTRPIDPALHGRFIPVRMDYMPNEEEAKMLIKRFGISSTDADMICAIASDIRNLYKKGELSTTVTTRHTINAARYIANGMPRLDAIQFVFKTPFYDGCGGYDSDEVSQIENIIIKY